MDGVIPPRELGEPSRVEDERVLLLQAIAQGLADDAAGRVMDTRALKESLARELGPIEWP